MMAVREFYKVHFKGEMYLSPRCVRKEKGWLTKKLYKQIQFEFRRETEYERNHPENFPLKAYFDGDVFTDAGSPPQVYKVTRSRQERPDKAVVTVMVYWNDNTVGKMKRRIEVVVLRQDGRWLIDNLVYENGTDLSNLQKVL